MVWKKAVARFRPKNWYYPSANSRWIDSETGLRKNFDGTLEKPLFMKTRTGKFTKKQKKVVAKVMYEAGWGARRISEWLKIGESTVFSYKDLPTPEALQLFEQSFKAAMMDYDMVSTFGIKSRIMALVPEERNIEKLVKAGQFFAGVSEKKTQNNTQVNVYGSMLKKYGENTTEIPVSIITKKQ
jgi:hypothetical protein